MHPLQLRQPAEHPAQRGTALVMTLVFLLLLTILGITASNTATLEERMAGNVKDQNLSFQAAETALAHAEAWVESTTSTTDLAIDNKGIYAPVTSGQTEVWETVNWSDPDEVLIYPGTPGNAVTATTGLLGDVNTMPTYIIEVVTTEPLVPAGTGNRVTVRITARGTGASDSTESIVQSVTSKDYPP
jgi:type IV pilus assembly protein PilX